MGSHSGAYVCFVCKKYVRRAKNEIGGRQSQTKPDQQEFLVQENAYTSNVAR